MHLNLGSNVRRAGASRLLAGSVVAAFVIAACGGSNSPTSSGKQPSGPVTMGVLSCFTGTLSSLGVYSGKLDVPYEAFAAGLGDHKIVTTLCPGGKERMRRLMEVVRHGRVDFTPLLTHTFALDQISEAYELFGERRDGVMKVAIKP